MMEIKLNMNNLTEQERDTLMGLVEKANKPVSKVWKPEPGKLYQYIDYDGEIQSKTQNDTITDKEIYNIGNCFKTEEEALFAAEKLKVIAELKRFAEEHNEGKIDWDAVTHKTCLRYGHVSKEVQIETWQHIQYPSIYFTSEEIARRAIETISADRLKKYYFEVED